MRGDYIKPWLFLPALLAVWAWFSGAVWASDARQVIRIGVLAFRGHEHAISAWQPVAEFLDRRIDQYDFRIVPLNLSQMEQATADGELDFILTNPGNYVLLETRYGVSRIATLKRRWKGQEYSQYGAVIFTRRDNNDIHTLSDMRGHSFMAVNNHAFGGFQMAWRELKHAGIDPFSDLSELKYNGFPQDNIVYSVLRGDVDVGTVRTGLLENLGLLGKISLQDIRVLNSRLDTGRFPFLVSTRLYPEWPLAKLSQTSERLAREIVVALFSAADDQFGLTSDNRFSWTIPMDYSQVHELMRELRIGPYAPDESLTFAHLIELYGKWFLMFLLIMIGLAMVTAMVLRANQRLRETQHLLTSEVRERRQAEQKLEENKRLLEQRVEERTARLNDVNRELEADIEARKRVEKALRDSEQTLRELNRIASEYPVPLERKLQALLNVGRAHFGFEYATLYRRENGGVAIASRVGGDDAAAVTLRDLEVSELEQLLERDDMVLTRQHVASSEGGGDTCIAVRVVVEGEPFGFLCLADKGVQTRELNKVDRDILQLLADWIGMEIARKQGVDREQQHISDLAHVARLGTMGEMASGLAHELNQPLTAIANYTRGILRRIRNGRIDDAELEAILERSASEAERAAEVIRRIRAFVNKDDSSRSPVVLKRLVERVADFVRPELDSRGIRLQVSLHGDDSQIMADQIQIEQVLLNLIRNASDALMDKREGKREITIMVRKGDDDTLMTQVRDNAGALGEVDIGRIYDPFYTTKEDGMGLGLSISKTIIDAHGGTMYTESEEGTTIAGFELPIYEG